MMSGNNTKITKEHEERTADWFHRAGFVSINLDNDDSIIGKGSKRPDWIFKKDNLTILCEVKTIFSGGQQKKGLLNEIDSSQLTPGDSKHYGELEYTKFLEYLKNRFENDIRVKHLPFDLNINCSGYEILNFTEIIKDHFFDRVIHWILHYSQIQASADGPFSPLMGEEEFVLKNAIPANKSPTGKRIRSVSIDLSLWRTSRDKNFQVQFGSGSHPYSNITYTLKEALSQILAVKEFVESDNEDLLSVISCWSQSPNFNVEKFLMTELLDFQMGFREDQQISLNDSVLAIVNEVFKHSSAVKQHDLTAIMLFGERPIYEDESSSITELKTMEDVERLFSRKVLKWIPHACIFVNPNRPDLRNKLIEAFSTNTEDFFIVPWPDEFKRRQN